MENSSASLFLIDGFPRNLDNVNGWNEVAGNDVTVACVLFLDCPQDVMCTRLLARGETSGRIDDNHESIMKRFVTYQNETRPIISHFKSQGKVRHVLADAPIQEVWKRVEKHINELNLPGEKCAYTVQFRIQEEDYLR